MKAKTPHVGAEMRNIMVFVTGCLAVFFGFFSPTARKQKQTFGKALELKSITKAKKLK